VQYKMTSGDVGEVKARLMEWLEPVSS
jgi:hypothetical protein